MLAAQSSFNRQIAWSVVLAFSVVHHLPRKKKALTKILLAKVVKMPNRATGSIDSKES